MSSENRLAIQEVIAKFANSFDLQDWDGLEACFTESIYMDYSDLNGAAPKTIAAKEYVALRRTALERIKLHHLVGNYEIEFADANSATCRASMMVWRKADEAVTTSHCFYIFQLAQSAAGWRISHITQKVFWNEGASPLGASAK
ncbi:MAG: nuclear transport factor 2 family protein [Anaerolineales bacterium]|nr:nuclear transport factor 2 family protein [Anaerolineales bacterium]